MSTHLIQSSVEERESEESTKSAKQNKKYRSVLIKKIKELKSVKRKDILFKIDLNSDNPTAAG